MRDMMLSDYLSTIESNDFSKFIISYIRIKETAQFKEDINKNNFTNNFYSKFQTNFLDFKPVDENFANYKTYDVDYENQFDSSESFHSEVLDTEISYSLWENLNDILKYCRENNRIKELFLNYKKILKLHIDHKIFLDNQCFSVLLFCTEPSYIEKIFNYGLIRQKDLVSVENLYEYDTLFAALNIFNNTPETINQLNALVNSLAVFIYKTQSNNHMKSILDSLNNKLAVFVNKESAVLKTNKSWSDLKNKGIKILLKAIYLNGIFQKSTLNQLLNNKDTIYNSDSTDSDSDSDTWPSRDSMNFEDEDISMNFDENNNIIVRQAEVAASISDGTSFGERINLEPFTDQINNMFPFSLKNLVRLKIKRSLVNYTAQTVNRLDSLPRDLRKFLLFQDEVDAASKSATC